MIGKLSVNLLPASLVALAVGGCASPASTAPPPPPQGWVLQSEIEDPIPESKGFRTVDEVLDDYLELLQRFEGAAGNVRRGERWAVVDVNAAAINAGLAGAPRSETLEHLPAQLRLFVTRDARGSFTIKQSMYAAPFRGR